MDYLNYQVGMSWNSYEGSLFRETSTTWVDAYSAEEAAQKARSEFGHNTGFQIEYTSLNK